MRNGLMAEGMSKGPEARTWTILPAVQICEEASERLGKGWGHLGTEEEMGCLQQGFAQSKHLSGAG